MHGERAGPFRMVAPIGRGANGEVWTAVHDGSGATVAVKVLSRAASSERTARALLREAEVVARLDHPHVVRVFDRGVLDGRPWLAMELATPGSLERNRPSTWEEVRAVLDGVLAGLAHTHAAGVMHLDLKPENVLVCGPDDLRPGTKLSDFGFAHVAGEDAATGGTPAFLAPERLSPGVGAVGPWTDLYAVGGLACWLVTGEVPFARPTVESTLRAIVAEAPPVLSAAHGPPGFAEWVAALLRKDPYARPDHAGLVRDALLALDRTATVPLRAAPRDEVRTPSSARTFALDELPEADVAQVPEPVAAPLGRRPVPPRLGSALDLDQRPRDAGLGLAGFREPPLVGRDGETAQVLAVAREAFEQRRIAIVRVRGPSGTGRSAFVAHVARGLAEAGAARVLRVERGIEEALAREAGIEDLAGAARVERLRRWLRGADVDPDAVLAALDAPGTGWPTLIRLLAATDDRPWVVLADDSEGGGPFVARLADAAGIVPARLLALVTAPEAPGGRSSAADVQLRPLSDARLAEVARALLPLEGELAGAIARLAKVPAGVVLAVRRLAAEGRLAPGPDGWRLADPSVPLAEDLAEAGPRFRTALAGLPDRAREWVALSAVLGEHGAFRDAVARQLGLEPCPAADDRCVAAGLAVPGPVGELVFSSPLLASGALVDVPTGRRAALHGACADVLPRTDAFRPARARHLVEAGRWVDEWKLVMVALGVEWPLAPMTETWLSALEATVPADAPPVVVTNLRMVRANQRLAIGDPAAAARMLDDLLADLSSVGSRRLASELLRLGGEARRDLGDRDGAVALIERARAVARDDGDPVTEYRALHLLLQVPGFDATIELGQEALEVARRTGNVHLLGTALNNCAHALAESGQEDAAVPLWEEALEVLRADPVRSVVRVNLAVVRIGQGDVDASVAELEEVERQAASELWPVAATAALCGLLYGYAVARRWAEWDAALARWRARMHEVGREVPSGWTVPDATWPALADQPERAARLRAVEQGHHTR